MKNKAQQEIVGFVLIVTLVVIGMVVYLGINMNKTTGKSESLEVSAILDALMLQDTKCATVYAPDYDNFRNLFQSAYKGDTCANLNNKPSKEYLEEYAKEVLDDVFATEATISGYTLRFSAGEDEDLLEGISEIESGNKTRTYKAATKIIPSGRSEKLVVVLRIFYL